MRRYVVIALLALVWLARDARAQVGRLIVEAEEEVAEPFVETFIRTVKSGYEARLRPGQHTPETLEALKIDRPPSTAEQIRIRLSTEQATKLAALEDTVFVSRDAVRKLRLDPDAAAARGIRSVEQAREFVRGTSARVLIATDIRSFRSLAEAAPDRLVMLQRTPDLRGLKDLARPIKNVSVQSEVPRDPAEYEVIYGKGNKPTPEQRVELKAADKALASLKRRTSVARRMSPGKTKAKIKSMQEGDVYVLIGHSENGVLHFLDGDPIPIVELVDGNTRGRLVIVTCNSLVEVHRMDSVLFGTDGPISLPKAVDMAKVFVPESGPLPTFGEVQHKLARMGGVICFLSVNLILIDMTLADKKSPP